MALFSSFKDTIYIKDTSNIQTKISQLTSIQDQVVEKEQIQLDLAYASFNLTIEKQMDYVLKNNNIGMYVLHDINLKNNDLIKTIDYVLITPAHCYLIECKNLFGDITIESDGTFVRRYHFNGETKVDRMVSPYNEIMTMKETVKKKWKDAHNIFTTLIQSDKFDEYYVPLVVFAYPNASLDTRQAPYMIRNHTIALSQLIDYLQRDLSKKDFLSLDSQKAMQDKADLFMEINAFKTLDYTSNYTIPEKPKPKVDPNALYQRLVNYRKQKANELNIPEHQIYTDIQIQQLIQLCPQDMIELQGAYILEPFRLDLHGLAILDMVAGKDIVFIQKSVEIEGKKVEIDPYLSPEQVLYVEQFATKIDITNESIVSNYGITSINKAETAIISSNKTFIQQIDLLTSNLEGLKSLSETIQVIFMEIYMYKKAGEIAMLHSRNHQEAKLKAALETNPGIANELAYQNYQKTATIFQKQLDQLNQQFTKIQKIQKILNTLIEQQNKLIEMINHD